MSELKKSDLRVLIENLAKDANLFFLQANREIKEDDWMQINPNFYWIQLNEDTRGNAHQLIDRLLRYSAQLVFVANSVPLVGDEDIVDLRTKTKTMRSALRLCRYHYREIEILNDEDRFLGIRPACQTESEKLSPLEAQVVFHDNLLGILQILKLVEASQDLTPIPFVNTVEHASSKYRPSTAFIMMWMDSSKPELIDIADTVKQVFSQFNISAVRADDIEHEGQITDRVLNELRTSEFLFADLTGARPNVYYEVGYAHALNRRVILYRKIGTGIHFDLAGYNCPEYENLKDLREKLTKRLESITNRNADQLDKNI